MGGTARQCSECRMKAIDVGLGVPARRGNKADAGLFPVHQAENVAIEQEVLRLHREAPTAHRYDLTLGRYVSHATLF